MLVLKRCLPTPTMNRLLDSTCTRTSVGHCRSCYTLMAHRHMDTESHSRPVARCPALMLRHTADHRPATNHASGRFLPQESVTWIKKGPSDDVAGGMPSKASAATQDKQHDPSKKHLHGYRKTQSPKSLTQRLSANLLATKIAILKSIRAVRSSLIDFKP